MPALSSAVAPFLIVSVLIAVNYLWWVECLTSSTTNPWPALGGSQKRNNFVQTPIPPLNGNLSRVFNAPYPSNQQFMPSANLQPSVNNQRQPANTAIAKTTTTTTTTPWPVLGQRGGKPPQNNNQQQTLASFNKNPTVTPNRNPVQPLVSQLNPRPINNNNKRPNLSTRVQQSPFLIYEREHNNQQQNIASKPSAGGGSTTPRSGDSNQQATPLSPSTGTARDAVQDDELREFSEILLSKDVNNAAKYVQVNYQGKTTSRSEADQAPQPLLTINQEAYKIPSIEKVQLLYNNYILQTNANEHYTGQEKIEENNLLDLVTTTPVMQHTRTFLIQKGKLGKDPKEFKDLLREIWFNMYSRGGGRIGSSGFEHVFLAEIKKNEVSGLHNWLYFHDEEKKNLVNYLGYMKKIDLGQKGAILKYHFTFHGIDKPVGSMFIGTSPELEMALYSTCFLLRADKVCPLKLNGNRFVIRTYSYKYRGKTMIGSAFPEI